MNKEQEKKEFNELYEYVKKDILQYPNDVALPKYLVMRLKGLRDGKFIVNKKIKSKADYPYSVIMLTFKFCKSNILKAIETKNFKNEQMKINYIMVIIENNINDIVLRLKDKEKAEKEAERQINKLKIETPILVNKTKSDNSNKHDNNKSNLDDLVGGMW